MPEAKEKNGESKGVNQTVALVDSIRPHPTDGNVVVVYKRTLTFKDGVLVKASPSIASEEIPIAAAAM